MNRREDPREAYVAIATRRFARDGFHGTSLAAVAKDAGVTKQALLHFFGTKKELYAEVLVALASRLSAEIEASSKPDPAVHLTEYLLKFAHSTVAKPEDAQLVVRALLESDAKARNWPMKSYLDRMIMLVCTASGDPALSEQDALAWLYPVFGTVQYFDISKTAIHGMYGNEASAALPHNLEKFIENAISDLVSRRS